MERWGSGHPRVRDDFEIEIPRPYLLNKIEIRLGRFTSDYPETIDLEVSEDGMRWKKVVFITHMGDILRWDQGQPRYFLGMNQLRYFIFLNQRWQGLSALPRPGRTLSLIGRYLRYHFTVQEDDIEGLHNLAHI